MSRDYRKNEVVRRSIAGGTLGVLLLGAGGGAMVLAQGRRHIASVVPAETEPILRAETVRVQTQETRTENILGGQVEPHEIATLSSEVADVLTARPVVRGDHVVRGQVIALLDERTSRAALDRALAASAQAAAARREAESDYRRAVVETDAARQQARASLTQAEAEEQKTRSFTRRQEMRQAEAALDQARTDAELARVDADRYRELVQEGAVSRQTYDHAQAAYDAAVARRSAAEQQVSLAREGARREDIAAATAQVRTAIAGVRASDTRPDRLAALRAQIDGLKAQEAAANAAAEQARLDLEKHTIRAPFTGRILDTLIEIGERAQPGTPLVRLGSTGAVKMTFAVPEALRPSLHLGQTLQATADAVPGHAFTGRLTALGSQADERTRAFPIEVTVPNPGERLLPNMVARLRLTAGAVHRRVTVPVASVAAEAGRTFVFLLKDGRAVRRDVTLGSPMGGDRVSVTAGLSGGEIIAATPQRLTDGVRVSAASYPAEKGS